MARIQPCQPVIPGGHAERPDLLLSEGNLKKQEARLALPLGGVPPDNDHVDDGIQAREGKGMGRRAVLGDGLFKAEAAVLIREKMNGKRREGRRGAVLIGDTSVYSRAH